MKCYHCKKDFEECDIQEHHIHPRFMDNKKGDGMKIPLCEKCHNILHLIIPGILWGFLNEQQQQSAIFLIKIYTEKNKWGGK